LKAFSGLSDIFFGLWVKDLHAYKRIIGAHRKLNLYAATQQRILQTAFFKLVAAFG
jgi:hypothetical protein